MLNLHFIIRTNNNQTYDLNTIIFNDVEKKTNKNHINKVDYKLEEKYNNNIYNLNTTIEYKNNKYKVKNENDTITIISNSNNTNIKINNNLLIGTYKSKEILINTLNIDDNEKHIIDEINEILEYAIKNMESF